MISTSLVKKWEERIYEGWADYFSCDPALFKEAGTLLLPKESILDTGYIHHWHIGKLSVFHMDPVLIGKIEPFINPCFTHDVEHLKIALGADRVLLEHTEAIYYLHPGQFISFDAPPGYTVRELSPDDGLNLEQLAKACTEEEVDDAWIEIDQPFVAGCFFEDRLVSVASISDCWAKLVDIGVLTHPAYRRQGLAKAVVSKVCEREIRHDRILQYRSVMKLTASHATAKALGFVKYFEVANIQVV